jgi:hypothetical protein
MAYKLIEAAPSRLGAAPAQLVSNRIDWADHSFSWCRV